MTLVVKLLHFGSRLCCLLKLTFESSPLCASGLELMTLLLQPPEYHNSGCEPPHLIAYFTPDSALTMSVSQSLNKKIVLVSRPVETSWIHKQTLGVVLYQARHSHQETARDKKRIQYWSHSYCLQKLCELVILKNSPVGIVINILY